MASRWSAPPRWHGVALFRLDLDLLLLRAFRAVPEAPVYRAGVAYKHHQKVENKSLSSSICQWVSIVRWMNEQQEQQELQVRVMKKMLGRWQKQTLSHGFRQWYDGWKVLVEAWASQCAKAA